MISSKKKQHCDWNVKEAYQYMFINKNSSISEKNPQTKLS